MLIYLLQNLKTKELSMNSVSTAEEIKVQNPKFVLSQGVRLINSGDIIGGGYSTNLRK